MKNNEMENKTLAIEKSATAAMAARGDLLVAGDETFGIALVYAYGTFEEFNELRWKSHGSSRRCSASSATRRLTSTR